MIWDSIRLRLVLAGGAAILILLTVAAGGLGILFERHVERRAVNELSAHLDQLIAGLEAAEPGGLRVARPPADQRYLQPFSGRYWQVEAGSGRVTSRSLWDSPLALPAPAAPPGRLSEYDLAGPKGEALLVLERRVILPPERGRQTVRVAVALDRSELRQAARAFLRDLAPFLGVLGATLIAAGWAQVVVGLRPLGKVGARVSAVRSGAAKRLGEDWPAEVRPLAAEVDALVASREADVARARARASDLAHALKTPLQALYGEARRVDAAGGHDSAAGIEEAVHIIQRHVDRELSRARIAATGWAASSDPAAVVGPILRVLKRTPDGARIDWKVTGDPQIRARIDAGDLTEALGAILENASQHAQATVAVTIRREGDRVAIRVRDDGPGVAEADLALLRRRGERLDTSRPGTGLGLAIVSDICEAAGGVLELSNCAKGFEAALLLPRVQPAPPPRRRS